MALKNTLKGKYTMPKTITSPRASESVEYKRELATDLASFWIKGDLPTLSLNKEI